MRTGRRLPLPLAALALATAGCGGGTETVTSVATVTRDAGATTSAARTPGPARDITRVLPSRPAAAARAIAPQSPRSLFLEQNLAPVIQSLTARFGAGQAVVQAALYPGEFDLVIATGNDARLVRVGASGRIRVGPTSGFAGKRKAASVQQFDAGRPQELARRIAARGGVPVARLDRFVLTTTIRGDLAGWVIHPRRGRTAFVSLLIGGRLLRVAPNGARPAI